MITRKVTIITLLVLMTPIIYSGRVDATNVSVEQKLFVTAKVLPMRRIIVDNEGTIMKITSNTVQDVRPDVYLQDDIPENKIPLSNALYGTYRNFVPVGTTASGILYEKTSNETTILQNMLHASRIAVIQRMR